MNPNLRRLALAAPLVFSNLATAHAQPVQPYRAAPIFTGQSLPEPPHQCDPWTPPQTNLPEKCLSAIQAIISYGFANPRGCEYREVEVPCGSISGGSHVHNAHAWVIPSNNVGDMQRFAVSWSGLVYPALAIGEAADVKADVAALLNKPLPEYRQNATPESQFVSHESFNELKVCTLLLLGEGDAAEKLWQILQSSKYAQPEADPYLRFAHEFAWANYDRAVTAHMRGDDVTSLLSAQAALRIRDNIEKDAPARGLPRPTDDRRKPLFFVGFLANIDVLLADEHRRVKTKRPERVLDVGIDKFSDPNQRITALIRDLEEVSAQQMSQPGTVWPGDDRIVQALIKEGEAAIDPLIECFENDNRLTRSVGFHRDFFTNRYFIAVQDAAFDAICGILKVRTFGPATEHRYLSDWDATKRDTVAKEIRAYWSKVKGVDERERWYQTLAEDKATAQQLLEIAKKIVAPVPRPPGAPIPPRMVSAFGPPRPMAGEVLRDKTNPSVTELLQKRADEVAAQNHDSSHRVYSQQYACEITLALAKWELQAAVPEVRKRIEQCKVLWADDFHAEHAKLLVRWFNRLCAAGIDARDDFTVEQYAQWLAQLSPAKLEFRDTTEAFYALCRAADNSKLSKAASLLFLTDSPWRPLHEKVRGPDFTEYVGWPLIGVPEFRQMVIEELRNSGESAATLKLGSEDDSYKIEFAGTSFGRALSDAQDPAAQRSVEHRLRVCDLYAWSCAKLEGAPVFEPFWPPERRDEAIAALIRVLEQFGDCYRLLPNVPADRIRHPFMEPEFHLSRLDHAATAEDVKRGLAIFSLQDGRSEVRQVELPMFPQMARWKTLDKFPVRSRGQKGAPSEYDRSGYIWQAEEILVDGKWQRYYGFVGNHIIAKVPAEEIEILDKRPTDHFDRFLRW
jgi:hypothetical protein